MRKQNGLGLLLFFLLSGHILYAQQVVWAKEVEYSENAGIRMEESAGRILGQPDALPYGEPSEASFRLGSKNGFGRFIVNFGKAIPAKQVLLFENYLPGRIHKVFAYDESDKKHLLYEGGFKLEQAYRILKLSLEEDDFYVRKIEVSMLALHDVDRAEIDAIGISSSSDPGLAEQLALQFGIHSETIGLKSAQTTKKINLDAAINSHATEVKPIISTDGNTLFFSRQNHPDNVGSVKDEQDIFFSKKVNGEWTKAQNLGTPVNNHYPNGIVALTENTSGMYVINEYTSDGSYKKGLSFSSFQKGTWKSPVPVKVKGLYNFSEFVDYSLSPHQDVMILAMKRMDSKGGLDLYVSFPEEEHTWSAPKNLGKVINSGEDDFAPFLAADGRTLYFSSFGHKGFGDADIFISRRLDDSWQNWSEPENIGPEINSAGFDGYFTIPASGPIAYMVSDVGSIGKSRDIFEVIVEDHFMPFQSLILAGQVLDAQTLEPVPAPIQLYVQHEKIAQLTAEPEHGVFRHPIRDAHKLILSATYPGYQPNAVVPDLKVDLKEGVMIKNIFLEREKTPEKEEITASSSTQAARGNRFRDYTGSVNLDRTPASAAMEPSLRVSIQDKSSGEALKASIREWNEKPFASLEEGLFLIPQSLAEKSLMISSEGFLSTMLSTRDMESRNGAFHHALEKIKDHQFYPLHVKFHTGTAALLLLAQDPVKELASTLHSNQNLHVSIYGPPAIEGEESLQAKRLEGIRLALIREGIAQSRIQLQTETTDSLQEGMQDTNSYHYQLRPMQELVSNKH